jgi:hypothetical protein
MTALRIIIIACILACGLSAARAALNVAERIGTAQASIGARR